MGAMAIPERRRGDRRSGHGFSFSGGRRRDGRRAGDVVNRYVDRYEARWRVISLAILTLCGLDAMFTLQFFSTGSLEEANPLMRSLLEICIHAFWSMKFLWTVLGLLVLLVHKNFIVFGRLRVEQLLYAVLAMYGALIAYEVVLAAVV